MLLTLSETYAIAQCPMIGDGFQESAHTNIGINGLVVDETITKVGRDFYELFYQNWNAPVSTTTYSLFIREQPMNGMGSQIAIFINETEIFTRRVQPRYDVLEGMAKYAVDIASQYVQHYESVIQQLSNEDQQGSGIF
ncbi:MAG: CsgE family curli-type amyloid fiber assembly protein [Bacteroidota bacterium]